MKNQNSSNLLKKSSLLALFAFVPLLAQAHHLPGESNGFTSGINHPIHGLDHILAMVAVGLWAAQLGGRAIWMVPTAFISLMTLGGALGMTGMHLLMVEAGIMASVLVLGLLITASARLPLIASMAIVGVFALFHGFAHGAEMPSAASGVSYGLGFVVATAALHACGLGFGMMAQKRATTPFVRFAGAAIAVTGVCLWLA
ncbi:HupE/UreJ family protein [Pedosphaera parvula]|uniref:HupE/UreJ protein n=1 Tax=Pedosphaera parvula (strain Ellin514) TaxID=320771 RepID=B9XPS2_PEDPL|nr:HupE/UreJ family protein [Pedosphaera parvula]EEF58195.1 HupE/UreJ protein [Pedosphaera parvula Ellin514]